MVINKNTWEFSDSSKEWDRLAVAGFTSFPSSAGDTPTTSPRPKVVDDWVIIFPDYAGLALCTTAPRVKSLIFSTLSNKRLKIEILIRNS